MSENALNHTLNHLISNVNVSFKRLTFKLNYREYSLFYI